MKLSAILATVAMTFTGSALADNDTHPKPQNTGLDALFAVQQGRHTFRYDTFGDEAFWGGQMRLHETVATLTPANALALGLKIDASAVSGNTLKKIKSGKLNMTDPKNTLALLKLNAVVGVRGIFTNNNLTSVGFTCALCHSTVNDSVVTGVGSRLDGWPNRDLNVGAIIAAAPTLAPFAELLQTDEATVRTALLAWGPGKFDAELVLDGKAFRPDGKTAATLIPPAFGLAGVNLHTYTGWGSVPYWNAFVANIEMHGQGNFFDPRLNDPVKFPVAARAGFDDIQTDEDEDLITGKLPSLQYYQLTLTAPKPPAGSFDKDAAERGDALFGGKADCVRCHVEPKGTEPGWNMHTGAEIGIDEFQASRSPDGRYRTTPLAGLFAHSKGGFFHDGRFATLLDVVNHYDTTFSLGLTDGEKSDLVQYLKSL